MVALLLFLSLKSFALPRADVWVWPRAYRTSASVVANEHVFLLTRHIDAGGVVHPRGPSPWPWKLASLTLVFRLESRPRAELVAADYKRLRRDWESQGVHVAGLQLDYDSPTAKLASYREDLAAVASRLPGVALSVTGLTDWLTLDHFDISRDVMVYFQLYRGSREHADLASSLSHLIRARFPFKIGILPGQMLPANVTAALEKNPQFKGYAEFYGGPR